MTVRARIFSIHTAAAALLCLAVFSGVWVTHAQEKKKLSIYSSHSNFSVAVRDVDGKEYVALSEVLQPLGGVVDYEGSKIKMHLGSSAGECEEGKTRCKIAGKNIDLSAKLIVQDGNGQIPLHSLPFVLTGLMETKFDFHENSRRMFLGNYGNTFKTEANKSETPSVSFAFSAPVNPSISTEPGKLRMVFSRDGINSGNEQFKFDSDAIPNATYSEHNGEAEIVVSGTRPLMAEFSDGGKTITIKAAPEQAKAAAPADQPTPQPTESAPAPAPSSGESESQPTTPGMATQPLFVGRGGRYRVVIDASHGGDEVGATLSDEL